MSEVTRILTAIEEGDPQAAEELLPLVYEELRHLAAQKMAQEKPGQTLQATALVHEAYIRLVGSNDQQWEGRAHFFAAAAEAMRRILIANARKRKQLKRGGKMKRVPLQEVEIATQADPDTLLEVHAALERLAIKDTVKAQLVKLRFFVGLTNLEAAKVLGISEKTAKRYWLYSKAWLFEEISRAQKIP